MSGSPKYSQADLLEQALRELVGRRQKQAEAEARHRQEQEEKERRRRVKDARRRLEKAGGDQQTAIARYLGASYATWLPVGLADLIACQRSLLAQAGATDDLGLLGRLQADLEALDRELAARVAQAKADEQAEQLRRALEKKRAEAEVAVAGLAAGLTGADAALSAKFDAPGRAAVEALLERARARIQAGAFDDAQTLAARGRAGLEAHLRALAAAHATWLEAKQGAERALETLEVQLSGLEADNLVLAWCGPELEAVRGQAAAARALVETEDWTGVVAQGTSAEEAIQRLLEKAQARQLQEERRAYIVNGLLNVLQKQGFQVSAPDLLRAGDLESDVVVRAARPDRRSLQVQVPVDGRVSYEVDGYARRREVGPDGGPAATCDEAEARLEAIHQQLAEEFGIQMGELNWEGKHPLRLKKNANELPGGGGRAERTRGGRS